MLNFANINWKNEIVIDDPIMKKAREFYYSADHCCKVGFLNSVTNRLFQSLYMGIFAIVCKNWTDIDHPRKERLIRLAESYFPDWDEEIGDVFFDLYDLRVKADYYKEDVKEVEIEIIFPEYEEKMRKIVEYMGYGK